MIGNPVIGDRLLVQIVSGLSRCRRRQSPRCRRSAEPRRGGAPAAPAAPRAARDRRPSPARRRRTDRPARLKRRELRHRRPRYRSSVAAPPRCAATVRPARRAAPARRAPSARRGSSATPAGAVAVLNSLRDVLDPLEQRRQRLELGDSANCAQRLDAFERVGRAAADRRSAARDRATSRRTRSPRRSSRCCSALEQELAERCRTLAVGRPASAIRLASLRRAAAPSDAPRSTPVSAGEVDQDLDDALRRAAQAVRIARAGRLLAGGEQADDRIELVGERHRGPGRPRPCRAARATAARRPRRRPAGSGSRSPSRLPRAGLLRGRRCRPSCPAAR